MEGDDIKITSWMADDCWGHKNAPHIANQINSGKWKFVLYL